MNQGSKDAGSKKSFIKAWWTPPYLTLPQSYVNAYAFAFLTREKKIKVFPVLFLVSRDVETPGSHLCEAF